MRLSPLLIQTKLIPPKLRRPWPARPRLESRLQTSVAVPLTLVVAPTGYGKTATLARFFADGDWSYAWYSLDQDDTHPLRFFQHLLGALRLVLPDVSSGEMCDGDAQADGCAVDRLCNELLCLLKTDTVLVLDDFHHVDHSPVVALVERLIERAPPLLHLVIATRREPPFNKLPVWRAHQSVQEVTAADLAWMQSEVEALFANHAQPISREDAELLATRTEGWAAALQVIHQALTHDTGATVETLVRQGSPPLQTLFDYLAIEVLNVQPPDVQHFLLHTAILRTLSPTVCEHLLGQSTGVALLESTPGAELFLFRVGGKLYRYHRLFREFLLEQAERQGIVAEHLHKRAGIFLCAAEQHEDALYHLFAAQDVTAAASLLESIAPQWIKEGRAATLKHWLDRLPSALLQHSALLLYAQGEVERLLSHYDAALDRYQQAEAVWLSENDRVGQSRALQGQAQVYLDTVRPAPAAQFLKRALKLLGRAHREESAALLHLLGENTANRGRASLAAKLHRAAERVWPAAQTPLLTAARVQLRTGKIVQARVRLQAELDTVAQAVQEQPPEAHREPLMLLSLLACWMGEPENAHAYAERGLQRGRAISSPIVEAVGEIRLGHSLLLMQDEVAAAASYERAVQLATTFGVARTKVEPLMGQVLLAGNRGDMLGAELVAREALAIVQRTGDEWMAALLWLALGAVAVTNRRLDTALDALGEAEARFQTSGDMYGVTAVHLWRALALVRSDQNEAARADVRGLLRLVREHDYDFLIVRRTLFTPRDHQMLVPVLQLGLTIPEVASYARELLVHLFPASGSLYATQSNGALAHPGVTLHIQMFGQFRVWSGVEEVRVWGREKARLLLQLLITHRAIWLQRDQIVEYLWPDLGLRAALNQFKVTLHALMTALEPRRQAHAPSFYIQRNGTAYRFLPPPDSVVIDVETFERVLEQADTGTDPPQRIPLYIEALALYHGDYVSDSLYEDWVCPVRDRLLRRWLQSAHTAASLLLDEGQLVTAIQLSEQVLARDPCWEVTYQLLIRAYVQQGNRAQALRTYKRCVEILAAELNLAPLPQTTQMITALHGS